jgi:hypothetical protein
MKWTIRRSGAFEVPGLKPRRKCGTVGQTEFRFSVVIATTRLDEQNFICDQFEIPKLFGQYGTDYWEASCEDFAAGTLVKILRELCPHAIHVSVEVSPMNEAGATIEWSRRDGKKILYSLNLPIKVGNDIYSMAAA